MKKFIALVLAMTMLVLCFASCSKDSGGDKKDGESSSSSASTPEKAIKNYLDYSLKTNINKVKSLAPKGYWSFCKETGLFNVDNKDELKECYEECLENKKEDLEEEFGENIKYSMEITKENDLKESQLNEIKEALKEKYDIPKKDVEKAKEVNFDVKISGDDDSDEHEFEDVIVVKIDGGWYVLVSNYKFADYTGEYDWEAYYEYLEEKEDDE